MEELERRGWWIAEQMEKKVRETNMTVVDVMHNLEVVYAPLLRAGVVAANVAAHAICFTSTCLSCI